MYKSHESFGVIKLLPVALAALLACPFPIWTEAGSLTEGLQRGNVELQSVGPATFAPEGILLVADPKGATIHAIATDDKPTRSERQPIKIDGLDGKIAALLGTTADQILVNDLAVNPETGNAYLTVSRGKGPDATPIILRADSSGTLSELPLTDVMHSQTAIPSAPEGKQRQDVTTDLLFAGGKVLVAGLSNEEFASQLRSIPFPFAAANPGTSLEIYHGAHGRFETKSPIRTFAMFELGGEPTVLAAYTCTPLVKFPLAALKPGSKVKGTTVAELGNRNRPLDIVVYKKDGKEYALLANSVRGLMKVDLRNAETAKGIEDKIEDTAGLPYETLQAPTKVEQLDRLDSENALMLVRTDAGALDLVSIALP